MKSFKNKVAIVTGGGGNGIGHHLVLALAQQGAKVAFCDIARLESTEQPLQALGADYLSATVNIADKRAINYWGVIHTTQRCYPHLLKRPEAAVVNLSSSQGILALPYLVPYCTTKFAVRGFTDALRAEHRLRGIDNLSFHTVHPGAVATDITLNADYHNSGAERFHRMLQQGTPPAKAAQIILRGVQRNIGRIFISDGRAQDILARLLPDAYLRVVRWTMRARKIAVR